MARGQTMTEIATVSEEIVVVIETENTATETALVEEKEIVIVIEEAVASPKGRGQKATVSLERPRKRGKRGRRKRPRRKNVRFQRRGF